MNLTPTLYQTRNHGWWRLGSDWAQKRWKITNLLKKINKKIQKFNKLSLLWIWPQPCTKPVTMVGEGWGQIEPKNVEKITNLLRKMNKKIRKFNKLSQLSLWPKPSHFNSKHEKYFLLLSFVLYCNILT